MNTEKTKKYIVLMVGIVAMIGIFSLFFSTSSGTVGAVIVRTDTDRVGLTDNFKKTVTRAD